MDRNQVVLVDEHDVAHGVMEKMEAHRLGALHRAFSVFIFNEQGEMLIHRRAADKYHGGGLWTNACCSHPQAEEDLRDAASERLAFEMGLHCQVSHLFSFMYRGSVENDLVEHEFDHVFVGRTDQQPQPNQAEVSDFKWIEPNALLAWTSASPDAFTIWFREALPRVLDALPQDLSTNAST